MVIDKPLTRLEMPKCVYCDEPTTFTITTWFSSGPIRVFDAEVETGARAPCCWRCLRLYQHLDGNREHILLV